MLFELLELCQDFLYVSLLFVGSFGLLHQFAVGLHANDVLQLLLDPFDLFLLLPEFLGEFQLLLGLDMRFLRLVD